MTATIAEKTVRELPSRDLVATRLLRTAEKHSYDPDKEIDWDTPPVPGLYWSVPEHTSLYGTRLWAGMTEEQRIEITKHEFISIASVGIWFEMILMQMLLRHLYDQDHSDAHARHTFTEIAEECRHSMMFGRLAETVGVPGLWRQASTTHRARPAHQDHDHPHAHLRRHALSSRRSSTASSATAWQTSVSSRLVRAVNRLHVIEEAQAHQVCP